jgi:hypothetical protein
VLPILNVLSRFSSFLMQLAAKAASCMEDLSIIEALECEFAFLDHLFTLLSWFGIVRAFTLLCCFARSPASSLRAF